MKLLKKTLTTNEDTMTDSKNPTTEEYQKFINNFCFSVSKDPEEFIARMTELAQVTKINYPMLLTAILGISSEQGEFSSEAKKLMFHNAKLSEENLDKLKLELGDLLWYIGLACIALNVKLGDIMAMNITKLKKRHG